MFGSDGEDSDNDEASFSMKKVHAPGYISLIYGTKRISVFSTIIVVDRMTLQRGKNKKATTSLLIYCVFTEQSTAKCYLFVL